jgi:decaprenylphospho-beta-D-erythro-pentofuranosid-2-ulose 2-reductase
VINAVKQPQSVLLLGGTSEIGLAILRALPTERLTRVILAGRPGDRLDAAKVAAQAALPMSSIETVAFTAEDTAGHGASLAEVFSRGDVDVAIVAFGVLGDQEAMNADPNLAVPVMLTNYVGAGSATLHLSELMGKQGHGSLIVMSSVAGDRARASNFVYGSTKAGLDALCQGLGDALVGSGVEVLVVRPGFVRTRMTEGLAEAPFSTTPEEVAQDTVKAWRAGKPVVYSPPVLRAVMGTMKALPRPVFRKVSARG